MRLLFKQRLLSLLDNYDIYDENGNTVYTVEDQVGWVHNVKIFDHNHMEVGTVKQRIFSFLPKFELYMKDQYIGCITKEMTFFKPSFNIDYNGWHIDGNLFEWNYQIYNSSDQLIASVSKEIFNWSDTYIIDVLRDEDAIPALMLVLAIDAEKSSRNT